MSHFSAFLSKLFVVVSLAFSRMPRAIALLDLFQRPTIARVAITRRRNLEYAEFFSARDRDGRRAAPIAQAKTHAAARVQPEKAEREYIRVRSA